VRKFFFLLALILAAGVAAEKVSAATPGGSAVVYITVNARVGVALQEQQRATFSDQLVIDPQGSDQIFLPAADQVIKGTNGTVFNIKVSSVNGTAVHQACTANGVSSMKLRSASSPADTIPYTFICSGDTEGNGQFRGAGYNTPRALGVSIKIAGSDAQAAVARADYSDTITMMITY